MSRWVLEGGKRERYRYRMGCSKIVIMRNKVDNKGINSAFANGFCQYVFYILFVSASNTRFSDLVVGDLFSLPC